MNDRQRYALTHPFTGDPALDAPTVRKATRTRRHARGFLLMSILAVDR